MKTTKGNEEKLRDFVANDILRTSSMTGLLDGDRMIYEGFCYSAPINTIKKYVKLYESRKPKRLTEKEEKDIRGTAIRKRWY